MNHPSIEFLRECFEADDGRLFWLRRPRRHFATAAAWRRFNTQFTGKLVCGESIKGYSLIRIVIGGRKMRLRSHRVIWALHYGCWPDSELDHRDRNKLNNRIENLREATRALQGQNGVHPTGVTGLTGAYPNGSGFCSRIKVNGKDRYLGQFPTAEAAHQAYLAAKQIHHE